MDDLYLRLEKFLNDAERIAQIHGYGFGDQPLVWPKYEQEKFAEWWTTGAFKKLLDDVEARAAPPSPAPSLPA